MPKSKWELNKVERVGNRLTAYIRSGDRLVALNFDLQPEHMVGGKPFMTEVEFLANAKANISAWIEQANVTISPPRIIDVTREFLSER